MKEQLVNNLKNIKKEVKKEKLILATDGFPLCQSSEIAFIVPELRELVKRFDVTIISCYINEGQVISEFCREFEGVVRVYHYQPPKGQYLSQFLKLLYYVFDPIFSKEIFKALKSGGNVIAKTFWVFLNYYWACDYFKWIKKNNILRCDEKAIYYAYWNQYYLFAMTRQRDYFYNMKIVSRIHGYDLFQERSPMKWQPFKNYMDKMTDKTVFISEQGKEYYERQYQAGEQSDKHVVCRLGVTPRNVRIDERRRDFLLVSCSAFVPIKKVDLIVESISSIQDREITWVHFGEGSEKERINHLVEKRLKPLKNIKVDFKGFFPNDEILRFYEENNPSCFITTSLTEGSPVSMQEAVACGIPVIGTNVGGIYEMIDGNGYLLSAEPTVEEVAEAIRKIFDATDEEYLQMRERSLAIWEAKFNREKNNESFIRMLGEL